jgi:hypothetical protein
MTEPYILPCPHCADLMMIYPSDIKCAIFRHAVFKNTMEPIPPHSTKQTCDELVARNQVYGCGKPFRMILEANGFKAEICDYL